MKYLKEKRIAIVLTLLVCVLASILGMRVSVGRQADKLEKVYQNNDDGSGKGLGQYLKQMDENAYNLIQLAKQEGVSADELSAAREQYAKAKSYKEAYLAYLTLCSAADRLEAELSQKTLSARSAEMLEKYYVNGIKDQKNKLTHMAIRFNESVEQYNSIFDGFPMNLLQHLIGMGKVEKFA